jgi:hypothetical protein
VEHTDILRIWKMGAEIFRGVYIHPVSVVDPPYFFVI